MEATRDDISEVRWRRILWRRQPFDDNYTDESFLSSMKTNENVQEHRFLLIIPETAQITQRISFVALFLSVFFMIMEQTISGRFLILVDVVFIFVFYAALVFLDLSSKSKFALFKETLVSSTKRSFVLLVCLLGLTPVLKTLTSTYSTDTIWALSLFLLGVHIIFHDYNAQDVTVTATSFQETLSLNAAIFGSVLLASRLDSSSLVFAVLLFAFEVFAGFPMITRSLRRFSIRLNIFVTLVTFGVTFVVLYHLLNSGVLVTIYVFAVIFVTIICPYWLEWIQRYKNEIQGPWDYDTENEVPGT